MHPLAQSGDVEGEAVRVRARSPRRPFVGAGGEVEAAVVSSAIAAADKASVVFTCRAPPLRRPRNRRSSPVSRLTFMIRFAA
jgi:hypothetical protein